MNSPQPDLFAALPDEPPSGNTIVDGKFWLVICTEADEVARGIVKLTRGYRYVHHSEASANIEAARLAYRFKGFGFAVVESMAIAEYDDKRKRLVWDECQVAPGARPVQVRP